MLLSAGGGRRKNPAKKIRYSFILQAQAQLPESLPAFSIARPKKEGKERGRGKIGIITHVYPYVRT